MLKKNAFYIALIVIYLLVLMKDNLLGFWDNREDIAKFYETRENNYYQEEYYKLLDSLNIDYEKEVVVFAKVLWQDVYSFFDKVTINKGSNAGIKKGSPVINQEGLVGIVENVYKNYSEVMLLTSNRLSVSVKINNSYGIMTFDGSKLIVKNIILNEEIKTDDKVYTSGLTDIPENILIGEVKTVEKDDLELEYIIEVDLSSNLYNIKYLGVITK